MPQIGNKRSVLQLVSVWVAVFLAICLPFVAGNPWKCAFAQVAPDISGVQDSGGVGSPQCGAVQKSIQLSVGNDDPTRYRNHSIYVRAVSKLLMPPKRTKLINGACSTCIINEFKDGLAIDDQTSCGTYIAPTQPCTSSKATLNQIDTATILSIGPLSNPWGDPTQFQSFLQSVDAILGCQVDSPSTQSLSLVNRDEELLAPDLGTQGVNYCKSAIQGVNYCGPGNSITNPILESVAVIPCLNQACFSHDTCYSDKCVAGECIWTPQSQSCDTSLTNACLGKVSSCPLSAIASDPTSKTVCDLVKCLNGIDLAGSTNCAALRAARLKASPECGQPTSFDCVSNTTISVNDVSAAIGMTAILGATLGPSACAGGQPVIFSVNGSQPVQATTDSNGNAIAAFPGSQSLAAGTYPIGVSLKCSSTLPCAPGFGSGTLTITTPTPTPTATPTPAACSGVVYDGVCCATAGSGPTKGCGLGSTCCIGGIVCPPPVNSTIAGVWVCSTDSSGQTSCPVQCCTGAEENDGTCPGECNTFIGPANGDACPNGSITVNSP